VCSASQHAPQAAHGIPDAHRIPTTTVLAVAGRRPKRTFGSIRDLPSNRYQVRVRDPRTNRRFSVGTYGTRREAEAALVAELAKQQQGRAVPPARGAITLNAWVGEWWPSKVHLRPKTVAGYRHLLDKLILPKLGKMKLSKLDRQVVARWRSELLASGRAESTTARADVLLRQVLEAAVDAGRIATNPCTIRGAAAQHVEERTPPTVAEALQLADARVSVMFCHPPAKCVSATKCDKETCKTSSSPPSRPTFVG
jgi:hypothetical protein